MFSIRLRIIIVSVDSSSTVAVASTLANGPWSSRTDASDCSHSAAVHGAVFTRNLSIRLCRTGVESQNKYTCYPFQSKQGRGPPKDGQNLRVKTYGATPSVAANFTSNGPELGMVGDTRTRTKDPSSSERGILTTWGDSSAIAGV
ncbi:hypothetical protein CMQ_4350 [Grosmannia clavigera kw1407]|uniref:Uncharacterized protein n=1 Tax=Grosmannia clavigera (strain kw1407 / UAMH 11150) TaxID=655863 RepID=F0XTH3_GROCL|nr:uncharacterized protein CMQ_4350 [Grosmannia clavigera kw1407]EFW98498.1 hypothetical protein CMQ_4350 [Grosmannia clavigera kw1407]